MEKEQLLVREFMNKAGFTVRDKPTADVTADEKLLRTNLIAGEFAELIAAIYANDIYKIADGLADILYLVKGTANVYGIDMEDIFDEVHSSNMTKLKNGLRVSAEGAIEKDKDYKAPDIRSIIIQQQMLWKKK